MEYSKPSASPAPALAAGHTVVGTVRSEEDLRAFEELRPGNAHGRLLDVTDDDAVPAVVAEVERSVGPLDVVVANAGYGLEGTFEETPLSEVRRQFEVNYDELFTPIREARQKAGGNQLGNPAKAGDALVHITSVGRPPAHLVLGSDALRLVTAARTAVDEDIRAWEALSRTTDFADGAQL